MGCSLYAIKLRDSWKGTTKQMTLWEEHQGGPLYQKRVWTRQLL